MKTAILFHYLLFSLIIINLFFTSCVSQNGKVEETGPSWNPEELAKIVARSQESLLGTLRKGLSQGSPATAISYCQERALPVTDSLSRSMGYKIRRTALRWRNPDNRPDSSLQALLIQWDKEIKAGIVPQPRFLDGIHGPKRYVAPIILKPLCLNCHGDPSLGEVAPETLAEIRRLYPEDKALGFKVGDLRGAWVVEVL
jgi:hypothetical protein